MGMRGGEAMWTCATEGKRSGGRVVRPVDVEVEVTSDGDMGV
jgi:hypothetical protein